MKAAAIVCWVASWLAVSVMAAAIWATVRGHQRARVTALAAAILAVALTWAGAALW